MCNLERFPKIGSQMLRQTWKSWYRWWPIKIGNPKRRVLPCFTHYTTYPTTVNSCHCNITYMDVNPMRKNYNALFHRVIITYLHALDLSFVKKFDHACRIANKVGTTVNMPRIASRQQHPSNAPTISPCQYFQ